MTITIEMIQKTIRNAKAQEELHRNNMHACAGAVQAYEQLLTVLIQAQRRAPPPGFPPIPGTPESAAAGFEDDETDDEKAERLAKG